MPPDWLQKNARLASDEELRSLQLRWARDDLWMRRISFAMSVMVLVASLTLFVLQPVRGATPIAAGAATISAVLSVGFFLSRQRDR